MFTKQAIIKTINSLDLEYPYKLMMGGSLVMRDIRDTTHDLDLDIHPNDFKRLRSLFYIDTVSVSSLGNNKFDIQTKYGELEIFEVHTLGNDIDTIDGINCQSLESILELKKKFNREKDKMDIKLIESKLST